MKCYLIPSINFCFQSKEHQTEFFEEYKKIFQLTPLGEKLSIVMTTNTVANAVTEYGEKVSVSKAYICVPDSIAVIVSEKLRSLTGKGASEISDDAMVKILYPKPAFREYAVCDKWDVNAEHSYVKKGCLKDYNYFLQDISRFANIVVIMNFEPVIKKGERSYRTTLEVSASGDTPEEAKSTLNVIQQIMSDGYYIYLHKNNEKSNIPFLERFRGHYSKTLPEEICAKYYPFLTEECIEDNGFCYGYSLIARKPIIYNRSDFTRIPHRCVVGGAGSGKSFFIRDEIRQIFENTSDDVVIFSQSGEYGLDSSLYEQYGIPENDINAVFLSTSEDGYHINPMDIVIDELALSEELIGDKAELIIAIFENLTKRELTYPEKVAIHNATDAVFKPFIEKLIQDKMAYSFEDNPTISDVTNYIRNNVGALGKQMNFADCSELLMTIYEKADYFRRFSYKTNIPTDRMIHICYLSVPSNFDYIAEIACVTYACNRMLMNRGKKSRLWMYWEDIEHLFFYDENKLIADRLKSMITKSRTHGTAQTILVYSFSDIAKSFPFHNIGIYTFMRQSLTEIKFIQELFRFSKEEIGYLINAMAGEGLFYTGQSTIPFKHYAERKKKEQE